MTLDMRMMLVALQAIDEALARQPATQGAPWLVESTVQCQVRIDGQPVYEKAIGYDKAVPGE